jgi:hypothetical protein
MQPNTATNEAQCEQTRLRLSRFLDNDVTATEATDMTTHLHGCDGCRRAYEEMQAIRTALRALAVPAGGDAEAVRDRVFQRLERAVRTGEAAAQERRQGVRNWGNWFTSWRPVVATMATAGAALAFVFVRPALVPTAPAPSPVVGSAAGETVSGPRLSLPEQTQMQQLFDLHDQRTQAALDQDATSDATGSDAAGVSDETAALTNGSDATTGVVEAL